MAEAARTKQSKPVARAASIFYHGRNDLDHTMTFSIDGQRWEYWLHAQDIESIDFIARRWIAKGLAQAKRRAYRSEKVQ